MIQLLGSLVHHEIDSQAFLFVDAVEKDPDLQKKGHRGTRKPEAQCKNWIKSTESPIASFESLQFRSMNHPICLCHGVA